jgi:pimeloyl-ACP methyl ester carboxylesterase
MPDNRATYHQKMQPWPSLVKFGNRVNLPKQDLTLFFFQAGSQHKQPLLMVHGLGDEADTWRHIFSTLAEEYHTLAIDLPGFGRSDQPHVDYTPGFMMDVVTQFLDQLDIASAIIMGSSLGGILAHGIAISHPERIKGLILVGGTLLQPEPMQDWGIRLMQVPLLGEWLYTRLRSDPDAAFASLDNMYHQLEKLPEPDREFLFTRVNQRVWSDGQRRAYFSTLRNLSPWIKKMQPKLPEKIKRLDIPTLVIRGEFDRLFPDRNAEELLKIQPRTEKTVIPKVGHLPHQEDPDGFLKVTQAWLKAFQ